ncbi:hypothetical protein [Rhodanobacter sp. UC4436_H3]
MIALRSRAGDVAGSGVGVGDVTMPRGGGGRRTEGRRDGRLGGAAVATTVSNRRVSGVDGGWRQSAAGRQTRGLAWKQTSHAARCTPITATWMATRPLDARIAAGKR